MIGFCGRLLARRAASEDTTVLAAFYSDFAIDDDAWLMASETED